MTTPWTPTGYNEAPLLNIDSVPGVQIEFARGACDDYAFVQADCKFYGADGYRIGIRMCLSSCVDIEGAVMAGLCSFLLLITSN